MQYYVVVINGVPYSVNYTRYLLLNRGWWKPEGVSLAIIIKPKPHMCGGIVSPTNNPVFI
jgi:hypothetical protein